MKLVSLFGVVSLGPISGWKISGLPAQKTENGFALTGQQIGEIRTKYCENVKPESENYSRDLKFCNSKDDEIPDWIWDLHKLSVVLCKDRRLRIRQILF